MSLELLLLEIQLIILGAMSTFIAVEMYKTRNGMLRRILVWYFAVQSWISGICGVYLYYLSYLKLDIPPYLILVSYCVLEPLFVINLYLSRWVYVKQELSLYFNPKNDIK